MENSDVIKGKSRSLTITIAIAFMSLSLVILSISSALEAYSSFQTQQKAVIDQQRFIAQEAANEVSNFIQEKFSMLEAANSLGNMATSSQSEKKLSMERLLGSEPSFRRVVLLDMHGNQLQSASRLSDTDKYNISQETKSSIFSQISQGKYVSQVYIDESTSEPLVIMAVPVKDVFGDQKGLIIAEVNLKFMWDMVGSIKIGNNGLAYVVDKYGNLIAFDDISRVLKGENLVRLKEVKEFVDVGLSEESNAEVSEGINGVSVISNYVPLGTPDWAVVVELPVSEAYNPVIQRVMVSALIMILSLILAIVVSIYLSKRITKPIINLRDVASEIGSGNLDAKIEINSNDEIGQLAVAFSQMTSDLKKSRAKLEDYSKNLEKQVAERTVELEAKMSELERFNKLAVGRELKMVELKKRISELESQKVKRLRP